MEIAPRTGAARVHRAVLAVAVAQLPTTSRDAHGGPSRLRVSPTTRATRSGWRTGAGAPITASTRARQQVPERSLQVDLHAPGHRDHAHAAQPGRTHARLPRRRIPRHKYVAALRYVIQKNMRDTSVTQQIQELEITMHDGTTTQLSLCSRWLRIYKHLVRRFDDPESANAARLELGRLTRGAGESIGDHCNRVQKTLQTAGMTAKDSAAYQALLRGRPRKVRDAFNQYNFESQLFTGAATSRRRPHSYSEYNRVYKSHSDALEASMRTRTCPQRTSLSAIATRWRVEHYMEEVTTGSMRPEDAPSSGGAPGARRVCGPWAPKVTMAAAHTAAAAGMAAAARMAAAAQPVAGRGLQGVPVLQVLRLVATGDRPSGAPAGIATATRGMSTTQQPRRPGSPRRERECRRLDQRLVASARRRARGSGLKRGTFSCFNLTLAPLPSATQARGGAGHGCTRRPRRPSR